MTDREQLGLGFGGLEDMADTAPYQPSSDTSRMAARMVAPSLSRKRAVVLATLRNRHLTCDQIEAITGMLPQTASARCRELRGDGFIVDTGRRKLTRARCPAVVWAITRAGERALDVYLARKGSGAGACQLLAKR